MSYKRAVLWASVAVVAAVAFFSQTNAAVSIMSRAWWEANDAIEARPRNFESAIKKKTKAKILNIEKRMARLGTAVYLTVHHTAVRARPRIETKQKLSDLQEMVQNGYWVDDRKTKYAVMGDVPYHFFISVKGDVVAGRDLAFAPFSNTKYKTPIGKHITVVLEGDFEEEVPNTTQLERLTELLYEKAREHGIRLENIGYHKKVAQTTCPGKNLIAKMPEIVQELKRRGIS